jgi:SNF2 family DNA or RNA helicase
LFEIQLWAEEGGILVLSYSIFRALVMPPKGEHKAFDEQEAERLRKHLLDLPNLVIADEAQEIKNKKSKAFLAANMIQTKCRIALTGSPLSNNLEEYYNLVDWIQEGYLGPMDEFRIKYIEPISEGLYVDASTKEKREGLKMLKVLTRVLGPKMDRPDYSVLHKQLHGKTEFVIRVPLSELQDRCYRLYVRNILTSVHDDKTSQALLWAWLAILTILNNHPKAFYSRLLAKAGQKEKSGLETPADEFSNKGIVSNAELEQASQELAEDPRRILGVSIIQQLLQVLEAAPDLNEVAVSSKMDLLFQILRGCIQANEKVLIFSHSLVTLDFIEAQLKAMGEKYYRIDGAAEVSELLGIGWSY